MTKASVAAKEHAIQTKGLSGTTDTFVAKQKVVQTELKATATSSKLASVGVKALSTAFNMFTGLAIMLGITKIIEGFEYLSESAERAKEKLAEIQTELSDNNSTYKNNRNTLVGLKDEYDTLTKKAETLGGAQNLANDEYERYQAITSQILGITPKLTTGWNEEGEAISNKNNLLQASIDLLDEEYEKSLRNNTTKSKNEDVASGVIAKLDEFNNSVDTTTKSGAMADMRESFLDELEKLETELGMTEHEIVEKMWVYFDPNANPNDFLSNHVDTYEELRDLISKDYDKLGNSFVDENNPIYELFSDEVIDNMIRNADEYFSEGQRILEERETLYQDYKDQLSWNAQATQDKNGNNAYNQLTDNGKAFVNEYIEGLDYASIKTEEDFVEMANDIQKFTKLLASNSDVSKLVEDIFTPATENETSAQYVERVQSAIEDIQQYCKDNYIDLPISFTTLDDVNRMTEGVQAFLSDEFDDKVGELSLGDLQIASELEIDPSVILSWDELVKRIEKVKSKSSLDTTTTLPFAKAWSDLKSSTDDATKGLADNLTTLAEKGQLTSEALLELDSTEYFKNLGISADEAVNKINALVTASVQLNAMSGQISKMSNMLADKKNGTVASASDLAGFDVEIQGLESWKQFEKVMGSSKSTLKQCKKAANELATEWVNSNNFLSNLNGTNKQYYITQLDSMGIENAEAVVTETLARKKVALDLKEQALAITKDGVTKKTSDEIEALLSEANASDTTREYLFQLITAEEVFNNTNLDVSGKISKLGELAEAYGQTALAAKIAAAEEVAAASHTQSSWSEADLKHFQEEINNAIKTPIKIKPTGSDDYKPSSGSGSNKDKSSDSKSQIDWIARKLERLQKIIDGTKAKFENLFTVKSKSSNLDKQIKQTTDLLKANEKAAKSYKSYADMYAKKSGLSKSLIGKIQNGDYSITDYDSDTADKINKYKEYWDLYKDAKQNVDELTTSVRKLKEEKYQLHVDDAEAKIAKSQAYADLDSGNYKEQNKHIDYQKNQLKEQYKYLIKIAKLNKDSVEVAKLKAEKQKELNDLTKQQFDNIVNTYDNKTGLTDNKIKALQNQISLMEAKGQTVGTALYTKQMSLNDGKTDKLLKEKDALIKKLAEIPKGSDSWYEAEDKLFAVDEELKQIEIDNTNLQNSINQLKFDRFDDLIAKLNDVVDETDFLKDMLDSDNLFDDKGMITDDGITAMGLTAQDYNMHLAETEKYKQIQADLDEMYAKGKISLEQYESKTREINQAKRESIKATNDARKAEIDYVRQGLDAQIEALEKEIDLKKELLDSEKDLYDFQNKIADQNKNIADIKKQINALESDDSEENRKRLQQLKSQLADAEQEQKDTLYDRSIEDQKKSLDEMLENSRKANEEYLSDSNVVFADSIDYINTHSEQVSQNLEKLSKEIGYDISENITDAWKDGGDAVGTYESILEGNVPKINEQINTITDKWKEQTLAIEETTEAARKLVTGEYLKNIGIGDKGNNTDNDITKKLVNVSGTIGSSVGITGALSSAIGALDLVVPKFNIPEIKTTIPKANTSSPVYNIDNRITVEGVATDKIVNDFSKLAQKQAENVVAKISGAAYAKGVRKK